MAPDSEFPAFFEPLLEAQYGAADAQRILEGCRVRRHTTLRANALKASAAAIAAALDGAGIAHRGVPWYGDAFVLPEAREDAVRTLPAYGSGELYLQSLSAMVPALVLGDAAGRDVCDLCAAPGGKTTQIQALAGGRALVTACELHGPRAERLRHNLQLQGAGGVTVMQCDARRLDPFFSFDRILLDAPCSGSGTLYAGDAKMPRRFTEELLRKSQKSQRALIRKALSLLRVGGVLVYATCSVLRAENEDIVEYGLASADRPARFEVLPIELPGMQAMPQLPTAIQGTLGLCPTEDYEGFFVAKVKRIA